MILPVISCCFANAREQFLINGSPLGEKLLPFVQEEIRLAGIHQECCTLALSSYNKLFASSRLHICFADWDVITSFDPVGAVSEAAEAVRSAIRTAEWLLVTSLAAGPIVASRITPLLDLISEGTEADMLFSCLPLPPNSNPAWLKVVPTESVVGNGVFLDEFDKNIDFKFKMQSGEIESRPQGSQWLPKYYYFDGAVAAVRCHRNDGSSEGAVRFVSTCMNENVPILFRLPFFQLSPHFLPGWRINEKVADKLLTRCAIYEG